MNAVPRTSVRGARLATARAAVAVTLLGVAGAAVPAAVAAPSSVDAPGLAASPIGGERLGEPGLVVDSGIVAPPATSASSYVVADAGSGAVYAALDPHGRYRPASTLKTLLAVTMLPRLDPNSTYTADREDADLVGARVGIVAGQTYKIEDLWYGLMLRSGNDTANALARAGAGGDLAKAVRMMNAEAGRLQALDTTAVNPSGLDEDGQLSSAYDLALIARAGLARRDFSTYVGTVKREFPGNQTATATVANSKPFQMYTSNRLLLRGYPGAMGVKTGYTTLARNTLVAAAERDGRVIIATLMGEPAGAIYRDAEALLDWGFANATEVPPVGELVAPTTPALTSSEDTAFGAISARSLEGAPLSDSSVAAGSAPFSRLFGPAGVVAVLLATGLAAATAGLLLERRRTRRRPRVDGSELAGSPAVPDASRA